MHGVQVTQLLQHDQGMSWVSDAHSSNASALGERSLPGTEAVDDEEVRANPSPLDPFAAHSCSLILISHSNPTALSLYS